MRIYISIDMEGLAGVVHSQQINPANPTYATDYNRFRRLMTAEANAAIEGALEAGASAIVLNDSHSDMRNLLAEELHEAAELISGSPKPRSMMEGIEQGFDAALFIGYHARAGTYCGTIDHTYTGRIYDVRINGRPMGELGLNAALAGTYGVPVALVSGDSALAAEAKELFGEHVATVVVKHAVSRYAARSIAPTLACQRLRQGIAEALRQQHSPFIIDPPITIEVDFTRTVEADTAELAPGSIRTGPRTVAYTHQDYREVFRAWRALYNLASIA